MGKLRVISTGSRYFDSWICTHCQTENISLVHPDQCSCCSLPRDPAAQQTRSEVTIDSDFYRDHLEGKQAWYCGFCKRQRLDLIGQEQDWLCSACGTYFNDPDNPGEKEGSGVVKAGEVLPETHPEHFQDRVGRDKYVPHAEHEAIPIGQAASTEYNVWGESTPINQGLNLPFRWPWSLRTTVIAIIIVLVGTPLAMALLWGINKAANTYRYDYYQVTGGFWSRQVSIEQSSIEEGEGFSLPAGATKLDEEMRPDGTYSTIDDPSGATEPQDVYDWVEQDPIIVPCQIHEGNTAVVEATCEQDVPPKWDVVDTIQVPVKIKVENESLYYFYKETVWSPTTPATAGAMDFNPYWPSFQLDSNQRESGRSSSYGIQTLNKITGHNTDRSIDSEIEWKGYQLVLGTCYLEIENLFGVVQETQVIEGCTPWADLEPTLSELHAE